MERERFNIADRNKMETTIKNENNKYTICKAFITSTALTAIGLIWNPSYDFAWKE